MESIASWIVSANMREPMKVTPKQLQELEALASRPSTAAGVYC
jgi:hypothetical protein